MGKKAKKVKFPKAVYVYRDEGDYLIVDDDQSVAIRSAIDDNKSAVIATYELVRSERATLQAKLEPVGKKGEVDV